MPTPSRLAIKITESGYIAGGGGGG